MKVRTLQVMIAVVLPGLSACTPSPRATTPAGASNATSIACERSTPAEPIRTDPSTSVGLYQFGGLVTDDQRRAIESSGVDVLWQEPASPVVRATAAQLQTLVTRLRQLPASSSGEIYASTLVEPEPPAGSLREHPSPPPSQRVRAAPDRRDYWVVLFWANGNVPPPQLLAELAKTGATPTDDITFWKMSEAQALEVERLKLVRSVRPVTVLAKLGPLSSCPFDPAERQIAQLTTPPEQRVQVAVHPFLGEQARTIETLARRLGGTAGNWSPGGGLQVPVFHMRRDALLELARAPEVRRIEEVGNETLGTAPQPR